MNGYKKLHSLDIQARADMIETVAGMPNGWHIHRQIRHALIEALYEVQHTENDADDEAEALRWLACLIERRLVDLGVEP